MNTIEPIDLDGIRSMTASARFCYWIQEREAIRRRRIVGLPWPWTGDYILQTYRFCNVRRMDDKVSQWLLGNWYEPYFNHRNMVPAIALARFINLPSSLGFVRFPVDWDEHGIIHRLRLARDEVGKVFNGAYMVRGNDGPDKIVSVVSYNVQPLYDMPIKIHPNSMEKCWEELVPRYGLGSFMAGQIVADMRWAIEGKWKDRRAWAPMGPGSARGLNRLLEQPIGTPMDQATFLQELRAIVKNIQLPNRIVKRLEMHDWQNCLCEFDKYERVLWGEGRPKQLYRG